MIFLTSYIKNGLQASYALHLWGISISRIQRIQEPVFIILFYLDPGIFLVLLSLLLLVPCSFSIFLVSLDPFGFFSSLWSLISVYQQSIIFFLRSSSFKIKYVDEICNKKSSTPTVPKEFHEWQKVPYIPHPQDILNIFAAVLMLVSTFHYFGKGIPKISSCMPVRNLVLR